MTINLKRLVNILPDDAQIGDLDGDARYVIIHHFPKSGIIVSSHEICSIRDERPEKIEIIDTLQEEWTKSDHYGPCEVCGKPTASLPLVACNQCLRYCCLECQKCDSNGRGGFTTYCRDGGYLKSTCKDAPKASPREIADPVIVFERMQDRRSGRASLYDGENRLCQWYNWQREWEGSGGLFIYDHPSENDIIQAKQRLRSWTRLEPRVLVRDTPAEGEA